MSYVMRNVLNYTENKKGKEISAGWRIDESTNVRSSR
jgi:hypothetical protein